MNEPTALQKYLMSRGHNSACRAHEGFPCMCWYDEAAAELEALRKVVDAVEYALESDAINTRCKEGLNVIDALEALK